MRAITLLPFLALPVGCEAARPTASHALAGETETQGVDLLLPADGFTTPRPTLRWSSHDAATLYELEIDDSEQCSSPLQAYRIKQPQRALDHLASGLYYACLRALDARGEELATSYGEFVVKADDTADPRSQNAGGGSGSPVATPRQGSFPLYLGDEMGSPSAFGAFADPADDDRLKLFVNDRTHRRVLVYDRVPTSANERPTLAIGQPTLAATGANGSARGVSAKGFADNVHVSVCPNGKVLVTDRGNHRVLVYDRVPTKSGARADLVIGQVDLTAHVAGVGPANLKQPGAAYCMDNRLVVLDRGNHRILIFDTFPTKNGPRADRVIGQSDATATAASCGPASFDSPSAALFADGLFFVADSGNNRVLAFKGLPKAGQAASLVLGQNNLASCRPNAGGKASARGLEAPSALAMRDGVLAVGDPGNHRVLFYFGPLKSGQPASRVLGQPDFERSAATNGGLLGDVASVKGLLFDGGYLWVADQASRSVNVLPLPY